MEKIEKQQLLPTSQNYAIFAQRKITIITLPELYRFINKKSELIMKCKHETS